MQPNTMANSLTRAGLLFIYVLILTPTGRSSDFRVTEGEQIDLNPVAVEDFGSDTEFASRLGQVDSEDSKEKSRGIFAYKTKSKSVFKTHQPGWGKPHFHTAHPVVQPPPFIHGWGRVKLPPPPPPHGWGKPPGWGKSHGWGKPSGWGWGGKPSKKPHYVKYWEENGKGHPKHHHPHGHKHKKKGWVKKGWSGQSRGEYLVDLAGRLAEGVGFLPEYDAHYPHGDKHNKHHFKGITLHNGFFTEVI